VQRIEAIIAHESFEAYMKLNEKTEIGREFCCHQLQHALDVARIYYILYLEWEKDKMAGEFENINSRQAKELIYAIGLLHDIGRWKEYLDDNLDHAEEGAALAEPILKDAGFNSLEIEIAQKTIKAHRDPGASGLGRILYRADKLSRNCQSCKAQDKCYKRCKTEKFKKCTY
jgi:uncharacterized protein